MSVDRRLARLEEEIGTAAGADEEAPPLIIVWPEDETPETRAAYRKAAAWYRRHGWPKEIRVCWSDGTEATAP